MLCPYPTPAPADACAAADIRATRLLVRGERGEIVDTTVRYLQDQATPVEFTLKRMDAGVDAFSTMDTHEGICARQPHVSPCTLWTGLDPAHAGVRAG